MRTLAEPTDHSQPNITATLVRYAGPTGVYGVESVRTIHCEWCRGDPESSTSRASTHGGQVVIYLVAVVGSKSTLDTKTRNKTMKKRTTVVQTCLGPIEVRTKFKLNWWLAGATLGLVRHGKHVGYAHGGAISMGRVHGLADAIDAKREGWEFSDNAGLQAANPTIHLDVCKGPVSLASQYHNQAVKEMAALDSLWRERGYTIANSI